MALVGNGIEMVRAFEVPAGIWADGRYVGSPRTALVKWRCCLPNMFYQVYVNGRYAGATVDSQQRQMIIQMPTSLETPVRIEVFAVEAEEANTDFSNEIAPSIGRSGRVKISLLRSQDLPIGATAQIYFDGGSGEIDYGNPLNNSPLRIWSAWQDKAGFGMSRFGEGDFGRDCAAAIGFGKGSFGDGQFGLDADTFEWVSFPLQAGIYKFALKITDEAGNESISSETIQVIVIPAAKPAEQVSIFSFDKQANQLFLNIS
jgi:hypothetical protein